jgi:hypothetical protein
MFNFWMNLWLNNELERLESKREWPYFKPLPLNLPGGTDEIYEELSSGYVLVSKIFRPDKSRAK